MPSSLDARLDWDAIMAAVENARAARLKSGLPGFVFLEIHEAPGKRPDWKVSIQAVAGRAPRIA